MSPPTAELVLEHPHQHIHSSRAIFEINFFHTEKGKPRRELRNTSSLNFRKFARRKEGVGKKKATSEEV
jgi:hypothetical protein